MGTGNSAHLVKKSATDKRIHQTQGAKAVTQKSVLKRNNPANNILVFGSLSMTKFNPLEHPICFTYPLRMAKTFWMEHTPFAMFLIDVLRPKVVVELGAYFGVSYCSFCQAVKELKTDTRCYAIDTWQGDPHNDFYGIEVLTDLKAHHDPLYGSFSTLVQSDFQEALKYFEDASVDLLHIDGFHTYEAVRKDFEIWLPKMSNQGVVLFHDTNIRARNFGVWKLWEELKLQYPNFDFAHECGLGLIVVGRQHPERLFDLMNSSEEELVKIREFFYQLGMRAKISQEAHTLKQENMKLQLQLQSMRDNEMQLMRDNEQHLPQKRIARVFQIWEDQGIRGVMQKGLVKFRHKFRSTS